MRNVDFKKITAHIDHANLEEMIGRETGEMHPFYNIMCELRNGMKEYQKKVEGKKDFDHLGFWYDQAREKIGGEDFALLAFQEKEYLGYVRFFRADKSMLRVSEFKTPEGSDVLILGAASIKDLREEDLQVIMIEELKAYASEKNFKEIYAVGWSNLPQYAQWGQEFMARTYVKCGFESIDETADRSEGNALDCMLAGHHGEDTCRKITEEIESVDVEDRYRISLMKYPAG
ncbi:MAG: hypothetical protein PHP44_05845 [Kiritimatiellae bacterium]|nr:hypothetical protein [Kiritimatiellia bacterium]MDD4735611.1 hypothetical protein [Kiritimatiellia bacterium]